MKKDCREIQGRIIDGFYNELKDDETIKHAENCSECREFMDKLSSMAENMDILDSEDFDVPVDMFEIINSAENIKNARNVKLEMLAFAAAALSIITSGVAIGMIFGSKVIFYMQIAIYINLPVVLIPILRFKRAGEV